MTAEPDYFLLTEFAALPDMSGVDAPTVLAAAASLTAIVEREVGFPFIRRTFVDILSGNWSPALVLTQQDVVSLTSIVSAGLSIDVSRVSKVGGALRQVTTGGYPSGLLWPYGFDNIVVTYVAGPASCPADVKDAVMWAARDKILSQSNAAGINARRTTVVSEFGTETYLLPGEKRPTGYPPLDALIASYVRTTPTAGFA